MPHAKEAAERTSRVIGVSLIFRQRELEQQLCCSAEVFFPNGDLLKRPDHVLPAVTKVDTFVVRPCSDRALHAGQRRFWMSFGKLIQERRAGTLTDECCVIERAPSRCQLFELSNAAG